MLADPEDVAGDGDVFWVSASLAISAMLVLAAIFFITGFTVLELLLVSNVVRLPDDFFPPELFLCCCCWTLLAFLLVGEGVDARSFRSILSPGLGLGATGGGVLWVLDRNVTELSLSRLSLTLDLLPVLVTVLAAAAVVLAGAAVTGGFCSCFRSEVVLFRSDLESDFGPREVRADIVLSTGGLEDR